MRGFAETDCWPRRILHEDGVDFSAAATLGTDYGAGFWTNRSDHERAKGRLQMGIPRDAFFAFGDMVLTHHPGMTEDDARHYRPTV